MSDDTRSREGEQAPSYGAIDHYLGESGREYFAWQGEDGRAQALYNKHFFQPYMGPGDDVLDFGCGGGFLLDVLEAGRKAGVEINPHARANAEKLGIEVYRSIAEVPGRFDRIMSSHALEHVPHPRQAILELKDKLRDERSRLLLLLPLDDWRARRNRRYDPADINMHLHTWTPQLLGNLLSSCEMEVEEVRVVNHAWAPKSKLLWRISPGLFHAASWLYAHLIRRRQLFAVAAPKS